MPASILLMISAISSEHSITLLVSSLIALESKLTKAFLSE